MEGIEYKEIKPDQPLSTFVDSFWMLSNTTDHEKRIVIVPDGRIDLFFSLKKPYELTLLGLESAPSQGTLTTETVILAISFKLLGIEYLFDRKFPTLADAAYILPSDYFGVTTESFEDFSSFCDIIANKLLNKLNNIIVDERKQRLFEMVYASAGSITVQQISETLHWTSRQINRYFNERFGISLKAYCTLLRFRASFNQIKEGKLFPEQNFTDQSHFIKNVKRFAGVTPKELSKNKNDQFIQFSTLPKK
nr:AraC family transcriptional regulator [Pedobacter panaciterrae]